MSCFHDIEDLIKQAEIAIARHNSYEDLEAHIYEAIDQCDELGSINRKGLAKVVGDYLLKLHGEAEPKWESLADLMQHTPPKSKPIQWQP